LVISVSVSTIFSWRVTDSSIFFSITEVSSLVTVSSVVCWVVNSEVTLVTSVVSSEVSFSISAVYSLTSSVLDPPPVTMIVLSSALVVEIDVVISEISLVVDSVISVMARLTWLRDCSSSFS